jgi:hypothetical protein
VFQITDTKPVVCASVGARILRAPRHDPARTESSGSSHWVGVHEGNTAWVHAWRSRTKLKGDLFRAPGRGERFGMISYSLD